MSAQAVGNRAVSDASGASASGLQAPRRGHVVRRRDGARRIASPAFKVGAWGALQCRAVVGAASNNYNNFQIVFRLKFN